MIRDRAFVYLWKIFPLVIFVVACRPQPLPPFPPTPTAPPAVLRIGLATGATPLAELVTELYAAQTGRSAPQFIVADTATLFADLKTSQLDAILVHHIPPGEPGWFNPVALDGLVIVIHPDQKSAVSNLTTAQVQAIFSGRLTNWRDLSGPDLPIIPVTRERGSGTRAIFTERVMADQRITINAVVQATNQAVLDFVAGEPAAVGYVPMASVDGVTAVTLDGVAATPATVAAQEYPLTTPLYFVSPAEPRSDLRFFLAWLQSDGGQKVLGEKYGRVR